MFVVGWVTRALYASSVFWVCSLAFDTASTVLPPALTKRSVSFSPCVRLRSEFCGAAMAGAKSSTLNTNGAVRAIDVRMSHPFLCGVFQFRGYGPPTPDGKLDADRTARQPVFASCRVRVSLSLSPEP